jgi:tetratricopeptide (TPR) repeat protein
MRKLATLVVLSLALGAPGLAAAEDEAEVLLLRARSYAQSGQCQQARDVLARPETPRLAEGLLWLGECEMDRQDYAAAAALLEEALSMDPSLADAALELGIAHYHLNQRSTARASLTRARELGLQDPRLDFFEGILLLDEQKNEAALAAFHRAAVSGNDVVSPAASYFEGLAYRREGRDEESEAVLESLMARAPRSDWAIRAQDLLAPVAAVAAPTRRWLELMAGFEYDSNVVMRGEGVGLPVGISGDSDPRMVWATELGLELLRNSRRQAGLVFGYAGSSHDDSDEFNVDVPSVGGWFDLLLSESTAVRFRYDFAYKWVGKNSFASGNTLSATVFREWANAGRTELLTRGYQYDYRYPVQGVTDAVGGVCPTPLCGPPGIDEKHDRNRDGNGLLVGLEHALPLLRNDVELLGGYSFHRYFARGDDYSFQGHELMAGVEAPLPFDLRLDARTRYTYKPFRKPSSYPDPDTLQRGIQYSLDGQSRRDQIWSFDVSLERKLTDTTRVAARYSAVSNDSTSEVFDYNRQIFGVYFTMRLED